MKFKDLQHFKINIIEKRFEVFYNANIHTYTK